MMMSQTAFSPLKPLDENVVVPRHQDYPLRPPIVESKPATLKRLWT